MHSSAMLTIILEILAVFLLVSINGFFVAAEFALVKVRQTQLTPLVLKGHRRARIAQRVLGNLDASLSACQVGITLASIGLGWIGEPIFSGLLGPVMHLLHVESTGIRQTIAAAVGVTVITFLHISAGEQAPKWLAIQKPLPTALVVAQPLSLFHQLSYPFIWVLNEASLRLLDFFGVRPTEGTEQTHSEEELRLLLATSRQRTEGNTLGREILLNALDLRHRVVRDVMRPRQEIVGLNTDATLAECLGVAEKTRYSRFPLCEGGDLDKTHGVVHFKDLFAMRMRARRGEDLLSTAWKLIYVPETARLERLLQLFLERKLHMAIVVDEYGGTVGLVTLENILEELVGQIQDEFDQEKPLLQKTGEQTWELAGGLPLHEFGDLIGERLSADGITTLNGWITQRLGGFPKPGDAVSVGDFDLKVEKMDGLRVAQLRLTRVKSPASPAPSTGPGETVL